MAKNNQYLGYFQQYKENFQEKLLKINHIFLVTEVPSLPGCISQGKSRSEALENVQEAIELYIESL